MESNENYKTARLCRQVAEALSLALSECGDGILLDLSVLDVTPGPSPGRLVVTVETSDPKATPVPILAALSRAQGRLRAEVARAIQRKRAPELVFRLAAPE
jgi:ribosome-binding factor A